MDIDNDKAHICCFTGHRTEKLRRSEAEIKVNLEGAIKHAIFDGYTTFISGMARGVDIFAAEIVLMLRKNNPSIKLICAVPFSGFEQRWGKMWKIRYNSVLYFADAVEYVSLKYHRGCFQKRNVWMVEHSSRLIAVYNGAPGGTKNTIDFANRLGIPIYIIEA